MSWSFDRATVTCALAVLFVLLIALGVWLLLHPTPQTTLVFYASPEGEGSACTETAPCRVRDWWPLAQPGATLLLRDGVYLGSQGGRIDPPDTLAGTADKPITVKALHDGKVLIDAEHTGFAVYLAPGNHYFHLSGFDATNGSEALYRVRSSHNRLTRLIGYNGTAGSSDSYALSVDGTYNLVEDAAFWGTNSRKIVSAAQSGADGQRQFNTFRRLWAEWNAHPQGASCPNTTYQLGYNSRQQVFENILGTVAVRGEVCSYEGPLSGVYECGAADITTDSVVAGALFYAQDSPPVGTKALAFLTCLARTTLRDVAAVVHDGAGAWAPFDLRGTSREMREADNVCERCVGVHAGTPSRIEGDSGWTMPGFREGRTLAEAMGGESVYDALPGLCKRYEGGVLTDTGLYPWPMRQRILEARRASGQPEVDVDAVVASLLGPIPDKCKTTTPPIPPEPEPIPPGPVAMTCTGTIGAVPGPVQMSCVPQARR